MRKKNTIILCKSYNSDQFNIVISRTKYYWQRKQRECYRATHFTLANVKAASWSLCQEPLAKAILASSSVVRSDGNLQKKVVSLYPGPLGFFLP